jgi:phosphonate transport system substrate-binding protein
MDEGVRMEIVSSEGYASDLLFRVSGKVILDRDGVYLGTFLAPNKDITVDSATVTGAMYGAKVVIQDRVRFEGAPALDLYQQTSSVTLFIPFPEYTEVPYADFVAAANALASMMEARLGEPVFAVVTTGGMVDSQQAIIDAMENDYADIALLDWLSYLIAHDSVGAEAFLGAVRFGSDHWAGQIMTYAGSGIGEMSDLAGRALCWPDPSSMSGYVIPSLMMMVEGLDPDENAWFSGSHDGVVLDLYHHNCDAGGAFVDARDLLSGDYPDVYDRVVPLALSPQIPNSGYVFGGGVPAPLREAVLLAILDIGETPEGQEALATIHGFPYEGFTAFDHSTYVPIETLITEAGLTPMLVRDIYFR